MTAPLLERLPHRWHHLLLLRRLLPPLRLLLLPPLRLLLLPPRLSM